MLKSTQNPPARSASDDAMRLDPQDPPRLLHEQPAGHQDSDAVHRLDKLMRLQRRKRLAHARYAELGCVSTERLSEGPDRDEAQSAYASSSSSSSPSIRKEKRRRLCGSRTSHLHKYMASDPSGGLYARRRRRSR
eukprot:scaffold898_cov229-Pinguiococcus_pyrenoidosus.AAC.6